MLDLSSRLSPACPGRLICLTYAANYFHGYIWVSVHEQPCQGRMSPRLLLGRYPNMTWKYVAAEVNKIKRAGQLTKGEKKFKRGIRMDDGMG